MRYVFRVDNSFKLGSGHLMRCLNLAKKLDGEIHFVSRKLPKNNNHLIVKNQFLLHEFESLDIELEEKIESERYFISKLKEIKANCVIIDHYGIGAKLESEVVKHTDKLLIIDDIDRNHIRECAILDQNYRHNFNYHPQTQFLGPKYAILNETFSSSLIAEQQIKNLKEIVVYFGASDVGGFTKKIYNISQESSDLNFTFVVGLASPDIEFFKNLNDSRINFFVKDMAQLIANADLFIGAVGTTSLERAYLGVPSLCVSLSDNQVNIAENLHKDKVHILLGHKDEVDEELIINKVREFKKDISSLNILKKNSLNLDVQSRIQDLLTYLET